LKHVKNALLAGAVLASTLGASANPTSAAQCLQTAVGIADKVPTVAMKRQSDSAVMFSLSDMPGSELVVTCYFGDRSIVDDVSLIWDGASLSREKVIAYGARLAASHTGDGVSALENLSNRCLTTAKKPAQADRFQAVGGQTTLSCLHVGKGFSLSYFRRRKEDIEN
jgi:hypothetical protein